MKKLKLIKFNNGKVEVEHERSLSADHPLFVAANGWPEVIVWRSTYWALMNYEIDFAEYSPTSAFVLE